MDYPRLLHTLPLAKSPGSALAKGHSASTLLPLAHGSACVYVCVCVCVCTHACTHGRWEGYFQLLDIGH